jgi:hypothetical protein
MNQNVVRDCIKQQGLLPRRFEESKLSTALRLPLDRIQRFRSDVCGHAEPFIFESLAVV